MVGTNKMHYNLNHLTDFPPNCPDNIFPNLLQVNLEIYVSRDYLYWRKLVFKRHTILILNAFIPIYHLCFLMY